MSDNASNDQQDPFDADKEIDDLLEELQQSMSPVEFTQEPAPSLEGKAQAKEENSEQDPLAGLFTDKGSANAAKDTQEKAAADLVEKDEQDTDAVGEDEPSNSQQTSDPDLDDDEPLTPEVEFPQFNQNLEPLPAEKEQVKPPTDDRWNQVMEMMLALQQQVADLATQAYQVPPAGNPARELPAAPDPVSQKEKQEREVAEKAEQERLARVRAEQAAEQAAEQERVLAAERAERARIVAAEQAATEQAAAEQAAAERAATERAAEEERVQATERAERARIAAEEAEQERMALERAERERVAAEQARVVAEEAAAAQAEKEKLAAEQAEQERVEQERLAAEKAKESAPGNTLAGLFGGGSSVPASGPRFTPPTDSIFPSMPQLPKVSEVNVAPPAPVEEYKPAYAAFDDDDDEGAQSGFSGLRMPTMPTEPTMPPAPAGFDLPQMPTEPTLPPAPAGFDLPQMPTEPNLPPAPAGFDLPQMPTMPEAPMDFGLPQMPTMPEAPVDFGLPQMPSAPEPFMPPASMDLPAMPQAPADLGNDQIPQPEEFNLPAQFEFPEPDSIALNPSSAPMHATGEQGSFAGNSLPDLHQSSRPTQGSETAQGMQAQDILYMIAGDRPDDGTGSAAGSANLSEEARVQAQAAYERQGGRGGRVKMQELSFANLQRGNPLIIAVTSPKGGVGKSTTAVNLGAYIARVGQMMASKGKTQNAEPPRVLVLDGDVANGNLAIRVADRLKPNLLNLLTHMDDYPGEPSIYEGAIGGGKAMINFVLFHEDLPNLNILAAPDNPDVFYDLREEDYSNIITLLGRFYDVIVIDSGTEVVMESNRSWLKNAHQVFLLTVPERAALHSAAKYARYVGEAKEPSNDYPGGRPAIISPNQMNVVMMQADADLGLEPRYAMDNFFPWAIESHRFYFADFYKETAKANNRGAFLVLENPNYSAEIGKLARAAFQRYAEVASRQYDMQNSLR